MYRAIHDPTSANWQVVDPEGSWVAGPWKKMSIAQDVAEALNMASESREQKESQRDQQG